MLYIKILNNDQVKIQSNKSEKYLPIITALKEKKTEFFTYQRKEDRNFKILEIYILQWTLKI